MSLSLPTFLRFFIYNIHFVIILDKLVIIVLILICMRSALLRHISQSSLLLCLGLRWRAVLAYVGWMPLDKSKLKDGLQEHIKWAPLSREHSRYWPRLK